MTHYNFPINNLQIRTSNSTSTPTGLYKQGVKVTYICLCSNLKIILKWTTHIPQLNYDRQEVLKYELDTVQTQFHAIEAST